MVASYTHTNENLDAIIDGLSICPEDKVLAVLGSGDQAFAMVERGALVHAVDLNFAQVLFAQKRINFLRDGKYDAFLNVSDDVFLNRSKSREAIERDRYFEQENRLDKLTSALSRLFISCKSIGRQLEASDSDSFNKIYLSNIPVDNFLFSECARVLSQGGMAYYCDLSFPNSELSFSHGDLILDRDSIKRSQEAYDSCKSRGIRYGWNSIVLRKV